MTSEVAADIPRERWLEVIAKSIELRVQGSDTPQKNPKKLQGNAGFA